MTPHPHFPTPAQSTRLLNAVADCMAKKSLDGETYIYQGIPVEIVGMDKYEMTIATLDRKQTLRGSATMVCMLRVPLSTPLVGAGAGANMGAAGHRLEGQVLFA